MSATQNYEYSLAIWTYLPPIIITIGTVGHILTIIAVNGPSSKKTSFTVYLTGLAVVDLLVLYTQALNYWLIYAFDISLKDTGRALCKLNYLFSFCFPHLSSWLVMCLTTERVLCMFFAKKLGQVPGPRVGFVVVGSVVIFLLALDAHTLYGRDFQETSRGIICGFIDADYKAFFYTYWNKIHFVVYFALPVTVIILGNTAIVAKLFISSNTLSAAASTSARRRTRQVFLITLLISVAFVILVSPLPLLFFIAPVRVLELQATIFFHMLYLNHAINFFLYVLSGSRFREDLRIAFRRCLFRTTEPDSIAAISSSGDA